MVRWSSIDKSDQTIFLCWVTINDSNYDFHPHKLSWVKAKYNCNRLKKQTYLLVQNEQGDDCKTITVLAFLQVFYDPHDLIKTLKLSTSRRADTLLK